MFKPPFTKRTLNKLTFFFVQNVLPPRSLPTSNLNLLEYVDGMML